MTFEELKVALIEYRLKNRNLKTSSIRDQDILENLVKYSIDTSLKLGHQAALILYDNIIPVCKTCGGKVNFDSRNGKDTPYGSYLSFCSRRCMYDSKEVVDKRKSTNLKRFGETSWAKSEEAKKTSKQKWSDDKKKKFKEKLSKTYNEKYGVDFFSQTPEYLEKRTKTTIERYGVENVAQAKEVQDKIKATNLERYGKEHTLQVEEVREKGKKSFCNAR